MAGGPHAAAVMCMSCGGKAIRIYEGYEDDHYRCEACSDKFGLDWRRGPAQEPCWPPSEEEIKAMKEFPAQQKKER
jgi:DNA-directed RNA polymerase subunit RPC12/RpoP